jgi:polyisoprenyl-phosphate glycosyltransferase
MIDDDAAPAKLVTIIIPAFNEEENLPELRRRLSATLAALPRYQFECLVVDNCSTDGTRALMQSLVLEDPRWRYIRFSRNFGAEVSLAAGLRYARGQAVIFLWSDLQEPPEAIPTMLARWEEGADVVYGTLRKRSDETLLKTLGARIAYRLIYVLSDVKIPPNASDFRLLARPVVEALNRCGERNRYLRGLVHWVGFKQATFVYDRAPRQRGRSTTGPLFLFNFAINAAVSFSTRPLRWASAFGALTTASAAVAGLVYVLLRFLVRAGLVELVPPPPGWTTMVLIILALGGLQAFFLGIIGEYLAQVVVEVKERPLWIVYETGGFPPGENPLGPPQNGALHG